MSHPEQQAGSTGDPAVDALVAHAARTNRLPSSEHKEQYGRILEGLERELNADPGAAMNSTAMNSTAMNGTAMNGTAMNGAG